MLFFGCQIEFYLGMNELIDTSTRIVLEKQVLFVCYVEVMAVVKFCGYLISRLEKIHIFRASNIAIW